MDPCIEPKTKRRKMNPEKETVKKNINEILNDDCLLLIFEFLSVIDLITIESVCRRWRALSSESWKNVKILNFDVQNHLDLYNPVSDDVTQSVSYDLLMQVIERCMENI